MNSVQNYLNLYYFQQQYRKKPSLTNVLSSDSILYRGKYLPDYSIFSVLRNRAAPCYLNNDLAETMLAERTGSLETTLEALVAEIKQREKISDKVLYRLDKAICCCDSHLLALSGYEFGVNTNIDRRRSMLEKERNTFYREKRAEYINRWKDEVNLKLRILETFAENKMAALKNQILSGSYLEEGMY